MGRILLILVTGDHLVEVLIMALMNLITLNTDFNQINFVHKTGLIITGHLGMQGTSRLIFTDGSLQRVAFDEGNANAVADVVN